METGEFFTAEEKRLLFVLYRKLLQLSGETLHKGDCRKLKTHLVNSIQNNRIQRDIFGLNPIIKDMQTAVIVAEEICREQLFFDIDVTFTSLPIPETGVL